MNVLPLVFPSSLNFRPKFWLCSRPLPKYIVVYKTLIAQNQLHDFLPKMHSSEDSPDLADRPVIYLTAYI